MRQRRHIVPGADRSRKILLPWQVPGEIGLQRGPNLLVDGDCEAVGVAAWSAVNATLSKQGSAYEGLQCLRILNALGEATGQARQTILTVGKTYRITGAARGDGTNAPLVYNASAVPSITIWVGTSLTAWQLFDATFTAGNAVLRLRSEGAGEKYIELDSLYISEVV